MAQGRISRKDAIAFGYLSQLLLQSVSGVRAEYVAANGYRQSESKLKTSLTPDADDDPEPPPENPGNEPDGVILSESAHADERRTSPNVPQERPLAERIMGKPDYADILSRSLDMLDRKYDATPEGRCEANKLALELELMKPPPVKPAKDFFGQTVDLMRRFRDGEKHNSSVASLPSALCAAVMVKNPTARPISEPQRKTPAQNPRPDQFRLPPLAAPKRSRLLE